jgi:vacuolar-type H+-ATPase subunit H
LFLDELNKINESESRAEQMQKDARAEAKKILEDARAEAAGIIARARSRAETIRRECIEEGENTSAGQYEAYMKEAEAADMRMLERARANKEKAIDWIAERIVDQCQ